MPWLFSFDRDQTVDVNGGPVPLRIVRYLAHRTEHVVYAHGNQLLKREAEIPGVKEVQDELDIDPTSDYGLYPSPRQRLHMIMGANPGFERYICIDDIDLTDMEEEGWDYYAPDEFMGLLEREED